MATSVSMAMLRDEAPTERLAAAFQTLIEEHPMFRRLKWVGVNGDRLAYARVRGSATTPKFNPDSTMASGNEEYIDNLVAYIRPHGGNIDRSVLGSGFGSKQERIKARVVAAGKQYQDDFYAGDYATGAVTLPAVDAGAITAIVLGPGWELSTRGGGGVIRNRVVSGTEGYLALRANGDSDYGTEVAWTTTDADVTLASANPNYWCTLSVDDSDWHDTAETSYYQLVITSSTNAADGLLALARGSQTVNVATGAGEDFDISHLDRVIRLTRGNNKVISVSLGTYDKWLAELRTLPGANVTEVLDMPGLMAYRRVPIIADEGVPQNLTFGGTPLCSYVICADLNDGVRGLYSTGGLEDLDGEIYGGLYIRDVGELEASDTLRTRVTMYAGVLHLNYQGLTVLRGIKP